MKKKEKQHHNVSWAFYNPRTGKLIQVFTIHKGAFVALTENNKLYTYSDKSLKNWDFIDAA